MTQSTDSEAQTETETSSTQTASFSYLTCLEVIGSLTDAQVERELKLILDPTALAERTTPKMRAFSLKKTF